MINIHFIVNPIAGNATTFLSETFLKAQFNARKYTVVIKKSTYKSHAIELTQEAITEQADIIVACGGDGTINEVASCLINTNIMLGIIPTGSGNGLASNLKISKKIEKAIKTLKKQEVKTIDVGKLNDNLFFSNTGIGFDAQVIKHYEASSSRKLISYIKASIKSLMASKETENVSVIINNKSLTINPFLVFTSNSNEMGYNVSLTPKASLQDGFLDVLIVSRMNVLKTLLFGFLVLFKKHHLLSNVKTYSVKEMTVFKQKETFFESQIDGDFLKINTNTIRISILEKALKVIC